MVFGKIVIRRAKTIKNRLIDREKGTDEDITRMLQTYSCRLFGFCIYRTDDVFKHEKDTISKQFNLKNPNSQL